MSSLLLGRKTCDGWCNNFEQGVGGMLVGHSSLNRYTQKVPEVRRIILPETKCTEKQNKSTEKAQQTIII